MNPVLLREWRGRWRRPLTPILVFLYVAALAVGVWWFYDGRQLELDSRGANAGGRAMLRALSCFQMALASLLATTLGASSIVSEKELGMWTMLRLSPLSPRQIVSGKLGAALAFIAVLVFAPLPMSATLLFLGGVSGGEFLLIVLLQLMTALVCGAAALAISARSRTTESALGTAVVCATVIASFAIGVLWTLGSDEFLRASLLCLFLQAVLVGHILWNAAPALVADSPLDPPRPGEANYDPMFSWNAIHEELKVAPASSPLLVESLNSTLPQNESQMAATRAELAQLKARVEKEARGDGPIGRGMRFRNPVLQRAARTQWRAWCEMSTSELQSLAVGVALVWLVISALAVTHFRDGGGADVFAACCVPVAIWLIVSSLRAASQAFARDRAQGMLKPLLTTMLSPRDIVWGKLAAALLAGAFPAVVCLPLVAIPLLIMPLQTLAILLMVAALIFLGAALGLLCAWFCESPAMSLSGALVLMMGGGVFWMQILDRRSTLGEWARSRTLWPRVVPWIYPRTDPDFFWSCAAGAACLFALGILALLPVILALRPAALEKDGVSLLSRDLSKAL